MKFEEKDKIHFIGDTHFYHKNVIKHDARPFIDIDHMNESLITNWNDKISDKDIVFHLGDLSFGNLLMTKSITDRLNGKIHMIMGNHDDTRVISKLNRFESVNSLLDISIRDGKDYQNIVICHYPLASWNKKFHGSWHLHAHTHSNLIDTEIGDILYKGKVMDVGCMLTEYTPISYNDVKVIMDSKLKN
jgi:calcineurin-like phosphoesterase family protein